MIVIREKRENVFDFNFETISIHDIDFFDVAIDVTNEIVVAANDVIDEKKIAIDVNDEKTNEVDEANNVTDANKTNDSIEFVESEKSEIDDIDVVDAANAAKNAKKVEFSIIKNEKDFFDFLQCLMRTCSCNLMLLKYFSEQRLHANVFVFSFVIRCFSVMRVFSVMRRN